MNGPLLTATFGQHARAAVAVLLILGAIAVAVGLIGVGGAIVGAGVLVVTALLITIDLGSITEIAANKGGITPKRELAVARAAAAEVGPEEADADVADGPGAVSEGTLTELRLRLGAKLSYVAGHMAVESGQVNIGSLRHDGYLTDEQAKTADLLLTMSEAELARAPRRQRDAFLEAADELVSGIRAAVVAGATRKELKRLGWEVDQVDGSKRDLLAEKGSRTARVVPVFAVNNGSEIPQNATKRLRSVDGVDRRLVVVPNHSRSRTTTPNEEPAIVKLEQLRDALLEK